MKKMMLALFVLALTGFSFAQEIDVDRNGLHDVTGAIVEGQSYVNPYAEAPVYTISLGGLGIQGCNSATWECDGKTKAANGAFGYLWVGDSWNGIVYKIDTVAQAVVNSFGVPGADGLGWDGRHLLCVSSATNTVSLVDPVSGAVVGSAPVTAGWPHGICWKVAQTPSLDQYMWEPDFNTSIIDQAIYFTGTSAFSFPGPGTDIGSLADGWRVWISSFGASTYFQYDVASGANIGSLNVGAVNGNPRDGTWDGHHLWDVTWENNSWAWQWDLYQEIGTYIVTIAPNPKYQGVRPGDRVTIYVGIKNHASASTQFKAKLEVYNSLGSLVIAQGPTTVNLAAGQVLNYPWVKPVPNVAPGLFYVRGVVYDMNNNQIHEDWSVIEVLP